jgi:molybdopterin converting factor small subunit
MTRIRFTSLFGERIGGIESVEVDATEVDSALRALTERYPELQRLVWGNDGHLNPVMAVFLNERQLRPDEIGTGLQPGDQIDIIPAISGG